jgi:hypothetical protein
MSTWIIISWIGVAALTGVNVFVFLKLKGASEQMMKMAFPGAKDMGAAMQQMQQMMGGLQNRGGGGKSGPRIGGQPNMDQQLKQAMDMLQKMQKKR